MEDKSLFQKLLDKVNLNKIRSNSTVKKVVKGMCAVALSLSLMFTTACGNNNNNNNNNNNENSSQTGNNNNNQENPYKEYSQILQNVLTDEYYEELILRDKNHELDPWSSAYFNVIPYAFLEDEGYDIEIIKENKVKSNGFTYVSDKEPNNLYYCFRVETKTDVPYFTEYIVRYTLTDKEMAEYHKLHSGNYIEATFYSQEIAEVKTPTLINKVKCTVEAHNELLKNIKKHELASTLLDGQDLGEISLISFDEESGTFVVLLVSKFSTRMITSAQIAYANLENGAKIVAANEDGAFYKPCIYNEFAFYEKDNQTLGEKVTVYEGDASTITNSKSFEKTLNN